MPQPTLVIEPSGSAVDRFGDPDEIDNCETNVSVSIHIIPNYYM